MSQDLAEFTTFMKEFFTPTKEETYVDEHLKRWPCDKNGGQVVDWPDENSVLIYPVCTIRDDHIHYTNTIVTNCSEVDKIEQFQAMTDALPKYTIRAPTYQGSHFNERLRAEEQRQYAENKQKVNVSLHNLMKVLKDYNPKIKVYTDASGATYEQLLLRNNTKLYHQSRQSAPSTLNQGTDFLENDHAQAVQSEADATPQLQRLEGAGMSVQGD
jgi:hypothetical protein